MTWLHFNLFFDVFVYICFCFNSTIQICAFRTSLMSSNMYLTKIISFPKKKLTPRGHLGKSWGDARRKINLNLSLHVIRALFHRKKIQPWNRHTKVLLTKTILSSNAFIYWLKNLVYVNHKQYYLTTNWYFSEFNPEIYTGQARDLERHLTMACAEQIWSNNNRIQAISPALQSLSDVPALLINQPNPEHS